MPELDHPRFPDLIVTVPGEQPVVYGSDDASEWHILNAAAALSIVLAHGGEGEIVGVAARADKTRERTVILDERESKYFNYVFFAMRSVVEAVVVKREEAKG